MASRLAFLEIDTDHDGRTLGGYQGHVTDVGHEE
jgi:hypothetical protein